VTFPDELRVRRLELGLSQDELAARLQVTQQTISRWENGTTLPGPRRVVDLAVELELEPSGLLRAASYLGDREHGGVGSPPAQGRTLAEIVLCIDEAWSELRERLFEGETHK
jgi:transcriptional regulator with XRE-family HTH domain